MRLSKLKRSVKRPTLTPDQFIRINVEQIVLTLCLIIPQDIYLYMKLSKDETV